MTFRPSVSSLATIPIDDLGEQRHAELSNLWFPTLHDLPRTRWLQQTHQKREVLEWLGQIVNIPYQGRFSRLRSILLSEAVCYTFLLINFYFCRPWDCRFLNDSPPLPILRFFWGGRYMASFPSRMVLLPVPYRRNLDFPSPRWRPGYPVCDTKAHF